MRNVLNSRSVGPSPRRARAAASAHRRARPRAGRCRPRRSPACRSRAPRSARCRHAYCSCAGVERPQWLFSTTNTTGSFHTAARFSASWKSPSLVAPSPVNAAATRRSPRSCAARARPSATGQHRAEVADHADDALLERAEVERAVAALREAALAAEQLPEQLRQVEVAAGEDAEVAVHRQDVVVRLERGDDARRDRLLADAREPLRQPALAQEDQHLLLDHPGQEDRAVEVAQLLGREALGGRERGRGRCRRLGHWSHCRHEDEGRQTAAPPRAAPRAVGPTGGRRVTRRITLPRANGGTP